MPATMIPLKYTSQMKKSLRKGISISPATVEKVNSFDLEGFGFVTRVGARWKFVPMDEHPTDEINAKISRLGLQVANG